MNWFVLSLPLVTSLSMFAGLILVWFIAKEVTTSVHVPSPKVEEPPFQKVVEGFARVFPESKEAESPSQPKAIPTKGVKLLGVSVGAKNLALLKVGDKTVVLSQGEEKEGLKLLKVDFKSAEVIYKGKRMNLKVESQPPATYSQVKATPSSSQNGFRISRREIERITKDPGIMFREIRLVPYVKNGKTEGFIFEWIKPGSLFHRAGLRKGDVLVSINGMTIKSGEDAFRLLQVLRNEPSLRVVVLRGGQKREINIRID